MLFKQKLACSFCGKCAAQVAKLVAGRRGYICDVCAAEAHRIMSDWDHSAAAPTERESPSIGARLRRLLGRHSRSTAAATRMLHGVA